MLKPFLPAEAPTDEPRRLGQGWRWALVVVFALQLGVGLLVAAPSDAAPNPADPFLLVDGSLSICAVSRAAERLLITSETDAVNSHLSDLLVPADIEIAGPESLINRVIHAARGEGEVHHVVLRPAREFGIRFWARIAPCGPPKAALIVLADGR